MQDTLVGLYAVRLGRIYFEMVRNSRPEALRFTDALVFSSELRLPIQLGAHGSGQLQILASSAANQ